MSSCTGVSSSASGRTGRGSIRSAMVNRFVQLGLRQKVEVAHNSNQVNQSQQDSEFGIGGGGEGRQNMSACQAVGKGSGTRDWKEALGLG